MQVFIAGATGVLGRRLIQQFRERGHRTIGLARSASNEATIRGLGGEARRANLFDADSLARAAEGAEVIVHAATAIPTGAKPKPEEWKTNDRVRREGTQNLAQAAGRAGARAFIAQSITWVSRPDNQGPFDEDAPWNPDWITQSAADMEAVARETGRASGFQVAVLRFALFHSPDSWHTRYFGEQLAARKFPIVGKGDAVWSWIHLDDAASAIVRAAEVPRSGVWHVTDDQPVTVAEYLQEFAKRLGAGEPRHVPVWLARLLAGRWAVEFMTTSTRTSNARFRHDFGWAPRYAGSREALDQIVGEWRRENFLGLGRRMAA